MYDEDVIERFISKFNEIKSMKFVNSICNGSLGVGRTYEHLLGIRANNDEFPDFNGIEIKTKTSDYFSEITLFNCTPIGNVQHEIERLKDKYGYPCKSSKQYKILYSRVNALEKTKVGIFYKFKLKVDRDHNKIILMVFNIKDELIDQSTFWHIHLLESRFMGKCSTLAFINAIKGYNNGITSFYYYKLRILLVKNFDIFLDLLEKGIICVDFKIDVIKSGDKVGKIYDHGTSFKIEEKNLEMLFDVFYNSNEKRNY